ncbi:hypothetical protein ASJ81_02805 [Methanosarcina spelaei]|uniref:Uncharacterized protein n=1 Tax=Methanosarcina spelaei TaxID=1036679 RepID=A0A2A2HYS5_9EURY|nr:hypothetical protein [Methanosarcina spelaei]PAV14508.1 hypothetical protein ASJ81_02805 [Methanosarcina spelaei]
MKKLSKSTVLKAENKKEKKDMKRESKLRWRTPLQATGYVRATAQNSVKGSNNPKLFGLIRS